MARGPFIGEVFGRLTALEISWIVKNGKNCPHVTCSCICGRTTRPLRLSTLRDKRKEGVVGSCGCKNSEDRIHAKIGDRFGSLTITARCPYIPGQRPRFDCVCDCGQLALNQDTCELSRRVKVGYVPSCRECFGKKISEYNSLPSLIGSRFGKLEVISERRSGYEIYLTCRCECGSIVEDRSYTAARRSRERGFESSCDRCRLVARGNLEGKLRRKTPEYIVWKGMIVRCKDYPRYAGRGIKVCEEWSGKNGFAAFIKHVGPRPAPKHHLDRINNNGNYEPGNVRWCTPEENANNKEGNRRYLYNGQLLSLPKICRLAGVPFYRVNGRIHGGWTLKDALEKPKGFRRKSTTPQPVQLGLNGIDC